MGCVVVVHLWNSLPLIRVIHQIVNPRINLVGEMFLRDTIYVLHLIPPPGVPVPCSLNIEPAVQMQRDMRALGGEGGGGGGGGGGRGRSILKADESEVTVREEGHCRRGWKNHKGHSKNCFVKEGKKLIHSRFST